MGGAQIGISNFNFNKLTRIIYLHLPHIEKFWNQKQFSSPFSCRNREIYQSNALWT